MPIPFLINIIDDIAFIIQYIGLMVIVISVVIALIKLPQKRYTMDHVRKLLAKRIIFGLEFVIAADVLMATFARDVDDIISLGGIVIIRAVLGYTLRKELGR